jgi:hypothetical protein
MFFGNKRNKSFSEDERNTHIQTPSVMVDVKLSMSKDMIASQYKKKIENYVVKLLRISPRDSSVDSKSESRQVLRKISQIFLQKERMKCVKM